jgi:di/tricarboxylate transporter
MLYKVYNSESISVLPQGWRLCYYGAGIVGLIITLLTAFTLREPERQTIGEENDANANAAVVREDKESTPKSGEWKVMLQPRVIMLCLAASIRHTGKHYASECRWVCVCRIIIKHVVCVGVLQVHGMTDHSPCIQLECDERDFCESLLWDLKVLFCVIIPPTNYMSQEFSEKKK